MSDGIDERSEKKANELEDEAWEMARNGGIPQVNVPNLDAVIPKPINFGVNRNNFILGAVSGDIIGSVYEFHNVKSKDFDLFTAKTKFTDDSILTVATMEALLSGKTTADDYIRLYQSYGRKYTNRGWGNRFHYWIYADDPKPYDGLTNGSAMRASPIGWAFDTIEEVLAEAEKSASVSHNHPEGIKGAQAAALAVFFARNGVSKRGIMWNIQDRLGYYDLKRSCDLIREDYSYDDTCEGTVPEAITAFLESTDYEDAIRLAVSLGGDSDTLACITGGIAEAYYGGIPDLIASKVRSFLPDEFISVITEFSGKYRGKFKPRMEAAEVYAAQGVEYLLDPSTAWVAAEKFTDALDLISNVTCNEVACNGFTGSVVTSNIAEEKRIQWLVLRGDAWHIRQKYDLAVENYEDALKKLRSLPRVKHALLQPGIADIEEKIKATAREGVSEYPELAKYLDKIKEDDK